MCVQEEGQEDAKDDGFIVISDASLMGINSQEDLGMDLQMWVRI